jgi:two-component system nitrogen regulation response regulator GlnG
MVDLESTLAPPAPAGQRGDKTTLCATVVWHPDLQRIGEQCVASAQGMELSRNFPLFQRPDGPPAPLAYPGVSREPLRIERDLADNLQLTPPNSRMVVELNGAAITQATPLSKAQVERGAILGLGGMVLVCLHWMRCAPRAVAVPGLLGVGTAAIRTRELVRQVAATDNTVLLLGETGTGKEVVARAIYALSARAQRPLVTVNMATLNDALAAADLFGAAKGAYTGAAAMRQGLFTEAQDATLFLDEIGNTPASVQPMLLRVLETGDYRPLGATGDLHSTARLIAATDQDLSARSFNQALLRRLESFVIQLPPLRERREDIGLLLLHMLEQRGAAAQFPAALASRFACYDWPGNIRQLKHFAQRCVLALQAGQEVDFDSLLDSALTGDSVTLAGSIGAADVAGVAADDVRADSAPRRRKPSELTDQDVLAAMDKHAWCIQDAANELGISRPSMYKLLESNPQVRNVVHIPYDELMRAYEQSGGDLAKCAALLRTPSDSLRRHLRVLGILN